MTRRGRLNEAVDRYRARRRRHLWYAFAAGAGVGAAVAKILESGPN